MSNKDYAINFQGSMIPTEPEVIVEFDGETPVFKTEVLKNLITRSGDEDTDVFVICITGVFR